MITHIIFDNNGVLTTNDDERTYSVVSDYLGVTREKVPELFAPHVEALDTGEITQIEFYRRVLKDCNSGKPAEEFAKVHLNAYKPKIENQLLAKKLGKEYKIALLTNFGDSFWEMYPVWGLNKIFDKKDVFLSAELGIAKPDRKIFLYALEKLNALAKESVFIDDNAQNVDAARALGINSILYTSHDSLLESLKKLKVL